MLRNFIGYPISPQGINAYLNSLTGNGKQNVYSCLRTLSHWLYNNDRIEQDVIARVSPPHIEHKIPLALSQQQVDILLDNANIRDKVIIDIFWTSGARLSEVAAMKACDFDWEQGTVVVNGKGNVQRKCLAPNVKDWFEHHDTLEISSCGIQTMFKRLSKKVGFKATPHSLRRGCCVKLIKRGLSTRVVQAIIGWKQISMVQRYSQSLTFDDALEVYRKIPR